MKDDQAGCVSLGRGGYLCRCSDAFDYAQEGDKPMEGYPWIDRVMKPLSEMVLAVGAYNRIYEAVGRGSEDQGRRLVRAIRDSLALDGKKPETPAERWRREAQRGTAP